MKILGTTFESTINEEGRKKWNVDGPLAGAVLLVPFVWSGVVGFAFGRLTKRK